MSDSRSPQYLADGFTPTVTGYSRKQGELVLRTLDSRKATDLVSTRDDGLVRFATFFSEEQARVAELQEA